MCINAPTSLASFFIGEIAGLTLLTKDKERQLVGIFVMFYSLVQLFEYNIYKNIQTNLNSKLLLTNLAAQGIVFFMLMAQLCNVNSLYIIINGLILLITLLTIFKSKIKSASIQKCIQWDFISSHLNIILTLMYITMFLWTFTSGCSKFVTKAGWFFIITLFISMLAGKRSNKTPSYWCMASAVLAPVLLLL